MGGFVEMQAFASSAHDSVQSVTIKAKKPTLSMGSSFSLNKATDALPKVQINEHTELEHDLKKQNSLRDCKVKAARKTCKNCACGRTEAPQKIEKLELSAEQIKNRMSACGSCGLGDTFRCGTCPYRGLAPFKLGEKVSLSDNFLSVDI